MTDGEAFKECHDLLMAYWGATTDRVACAVAVEIRAKLPALNDHRKLMEAKQVSQPKDTDMSESLNDPMERLLQDGLNTGRFRYHTDYGGGTSHNLDFHLPDYDVAIEVKRFHSPRIAEQMSRHPNVIAAQGADAVKLLAYLLAHTHPNSSKAQQ